MKQKTGPKLLLRITKLCSCGCNEAFICKITSKQKYINGHCRKGTHFSDISKNKMRKENNYHWITIETRFCKCGCGKSFECKINSKKQYIHGHYCVGKISKAKGKIIVPRETRTCVCGCRLTFKCRTTSTKKCLNREHKGKLHSKLVGGENNGNWQGGKSFEIYPQAFSKSLKERIRTKDNHTCQECKFIENQLEKKLHIHHIDYNKQNNDENNLISLCNSCHAQTNFKRKDWTKYLKNKILETI